ncbi:MAG: hypothetical protein R3F61_13885 [Myxococcota bacterium]
MLALTLLLLDSFAGSPDFMTGPPGEQSLEDLYQRAYLVVVARNVGRNGGELCLGDPCQRMQMRWNELSVVEVLKGSSEPTSVKFNKMGLRAIKGQDAIFFLTDGEGGLHFMIDPGQFSVLRSDLWGNLITDDGMYLGMDGPSLLPLPELAGAIRATPGAAPRALAPSEVPATRDFEAAKALAGPPPAQLSIPGPARYDAALTVVRSLAAHP